MDASPIQALIAPVTPLQQNCTLVWCAKSNKAALIDPGGEVDRLLAIVKERGLELEKILITHGHLDHAGGAHEIKQRTGVPILVNTSFNTRGEPMVNSPRDAVESFWTSPLDALVIGPFLVEKAGATA